MALRKDDAAFKQVVDAAIAEAETSGVAAKLYQKWFQAPIPPKGLNLELPMSDDLKEVFAHPTDQAYQ